MLLVAALLLSLLLSWQLARISSMRGAKKNLGRGTKVVLVRQMQNEKALRSGTAQKRNV